MNDNIIECETCKEPAVILWTSIDFPEDWNIEHHDGDWHLSCQSHIPKQEITLHFTVNNSGYKFGKNDPRLRYRP